MSGVAAAGGCSFHSRARCSIRSTGTRSGLVSPLRTVLFQPGSDWLLVPAMAPAFDAELLTVSVELKIHIAQLMADAIRRIIQPGNIVGGHHYSISATS